MSPVHSLIFPSAPSLLPETFAQAYAMILASSPSKKVNISFSDSSQRDPISRGTGGSLSRRGGGGGGRARKNSGQRPPLAVTLSSGNVLQQHGSSDSQQCRPSSLASPTQRRVKSLSSASSLSRGGAAPLRAMCQYRRAASTGAVCR